MKGNTSDRYQMFEEMENCGYYGNLLNDELYADQKTIIFYQDLVEQIVYVNSEFSIDNAVIKNRIKNILKGILSQMISNRECMANGITKEVVQLNTRLKELLDSELGIKLAAKSRN